MATIYAKMVVREKERRRQPHLGTYQGNTAAEMEEDTRKARGVQLGKTLAAAAMRENST